MAAVVLNYNGWQDTVHCVRSLQADSYESLAIIVVDNCSTDGSMHHLRRTLRGVVYIELPTNGGYAVGNNAGIRRALSLRAEYVLVLNNDVTVEHQFLRPMVEAAEHTPGAGLVTCKVLYASEPHDIFSGAGAFSRLRCTGVSNGRLFLKRDRNNEEGRVDFACGVLFLARSRIFESVGFLREEFFMYFEDVEFSRRVTREFEMVYTPRAMAYHKSGGGRGWRNYTELYLYFHTRNRLWVFQEDPFAYRMYVACFTFINAVAKALIVSMDSFGEPSATRKKLSALFRGLMDGMRGTSVPLRSRQ